MRYFTQFYANSYRICEFGKVLNMIRRTIIRLRGNTLKIRTIKMKNFTLYNLLITFSKQVLFKNKFWIKLASLILRIRSAGWGLPPVSKGLEVASRPRLVFELQTRPPFFFYKKKGALSRHPPFIERSDEGEEGWTSPHQGLVPFGDWFSARKAGPGDQFSFEN